jgi:hypothetical protein
MCCELQDMEQVAADAIAAQPTGHTLSTTKVLTKVLHGHLMCVNFALGATFGLN